MTMNDVIISADSHIVEPSDLWEKNLPWVREHLPVIRLGGLKPGGTDPFRRLDEMGTDGVSAEVIYPTAGLRLFGMDHAGAQEACFQLYNDWLMDYCKPNLERLPGIACISLYNSDQAVRELERCARGGLKGGLIWQVPHPELPLWSEHYNPFWEAAAALGMPVNIHTLTGHNYRKIPTGKGLPGADEGMNKTRNSVNVKALDMSNALFDLIFFGVLQRYPGLKIVLVEAEIGWLPFYLQQWDRHFRRNREDLPSPITEEPSFYFNRQVYATFFDDTFGCQCLRTWGQDNCMWSSDYPHGNSSWPHSQDVIRRDLGHLPQAVRQKLLRENVAALYGMGTLEPVVSGAPA